MSPSSVINPSLNRFLPTLLLAGWLCSAHSSFGQESLSLTGPRLLSRIARQPQETRPTLFDLSEPVARTQLAILIDGTTSMQQELAEFAHFFPDIARLYSHDAPETLQVAVVVYRDARSPSGPVATLSDFTDNLDALRDKLRKLAPETGEPYFPEALDQGLFSALKSLAWKMDDSATARRLLIIGDAPPYSDDHANRKHHDAELDRLIVDRRLRVDALLVNSGFPLTAGAVGTSRESATQAAPYAREFFTALTGKSSGQFLDLWDENRIARFMEPTVIVTGLAPLPSPAPLPATTLDGWKSFLSKHLASVRAERPALQALTALSEMKPQSQSTHSLLPTVWSAGELTRIILDLETALDEEPDNPVLHLLLANTHSLLATADAYDDHSQAIVRHVVAARANSADTLPASIRDEIDALYSLHVLGDRTATLKTLAKLNSDDAEAENPGCRLRSAWTALPLELGFWPATTSPVPTPVDHSICRDLVRQILKSWPESVEAQALRRQIDSGYNDQTEISRTLFNTPRAL